MLFRGLILLLLCLSPLQAATIFPINIGTSANDNTGDTLRSAFGKVNTNDANLNAAIAAIIAGSSQATNIPVTNATIFGVFEMNSNGVLRFFGIKQGTNMVLFRDGSNIVLNATGSGSGSGSVETQWIPDLTQFATGATGGLTLKSGAVVTNLDSYGTNEIFGEERLSGRLWPSNGVTTAGTSTNTGRIYLENHFDFGAATTGARFNIWSGNGLQIRSGGDLILFDGSTLKVQSTAYFTDNADTQETNRYRLNDLTSTNTIQRKWEVDRISAGVSNALHGLLLSGSNALHTLLLSSSNGTHGIILTASNGVHSHLLTSSNALHSTLLSSSNGVHSHLLTSSNALHTIILSSSNGVHSLLLSASNALQTAIGNLQGATNGLNTRVGNLEGATNGLNTAVGNLQGATNGLNSAVGQTLTNYYGFGYSVGSGFSNATSKPLVTAKANRMLEVMNAIAGTGIGITPTPTGLVWTSTGSTLPDADYGDITATLGGAQLTIDNGVIDNNKLTNMPGFSVKGKTDTGTGTPGDIVAGTDGVLRRSGSGNLQFGSLVTANYGDDSVTAAKVENITSGALMGRWSIGAGNFEQAAPGPGLNMNGALRLDIDQRWSTEVITNSVSASNIYTRTLTASNLFQQGFTNTGFGTNMALNWNGPPIIESYPTGTTFMVSLVGAPSSSNGLGNFILHRIIITNSPTMVGPSGVSWLTPPVLIAGTQASPSTNYFGYRYTGNTNIDASSLQLSNLLVSPVISGAHITGSVFSNGVVFYSVFTNGVLVGSGTNIDFVSGVTGYVNGATIRLGVTASGSGSGSTNTPVLATGILDLTNQIKLRPQELNGSNSYSVMMDFILQTHKKVTNPIGAHTRFIGTNYTQGHKIWMTLRGLSGTTNNVQFTNGLSGVNFRFHDWPTNLLGGGTNDIIVRGGFDYDIVAEVEDPTNITFKITSNDPYVPVPSVIIGTATIGTNHVEAITNLSAVSFRLLSLLVPTNNAASNIVVNYALTNRVEIYATNNLTFTNYSGNLAGQSGTKQMWIRPQLITRGVNWGIGIGYSVRVLTNAANPLWTSLTNDKLYVVTDEWQNTNIIRTIALFE